MKGKIYSIVDARQKALDLVCDKLNVGTPSDIGNNWNHGPIESYGIWIRLGLKVVAVAFADIDLYPIFRGPDFVRGYKHSADLTPDERRDLKVYGFFAFNNYQL